jgi:hypothetical protein
MERRVAHQSALTDLWPPMDGGAQSGPPPFSGSFFSFVLSLEDMRSRKDLAEDWLGDRDGILVFVRHTRSFSTVVHYEGPFLP